MEEEIWKKIHSLNDKYEASTFGRIRNTTTGYVLKQFSNRFGYKILQVCPYPGIHKSVRVHSLVAEAFLGARPNGMVVNHKDGNKENNSLENLEYVTPSENNIHALKSGLRHPAKMSLFSHRGEAHHSSKITENTVREIWAIRKEFGYGCRKIAKMLNVSVGAVNGVLYKKNWSHIKLEGD